MIANAQKQNLGGLAPKRCEQDEEETDEQISNAKQLADAQEQLKVLEEQK